MGSISDNATSPWLGWLSSYCHGGTGEGEDLGVTSPRRVMEPCVYSLTPGCLFGAFLGPSRNFPHLKFSSMKQERVHDDLYLAKARNMERINKIN